MWHQTNHSMSTTISTYRMLITDSNLQRSVTANIHIRARRSVLQHVNNVRYNYRTTMSPDSDHLKAPRSAVSQNNSTTVPRGDCRTRDRNWSWTPKTFRSPLITAYFLPLCDTPPSLMIEKDIRIKWRVLWCIKHLIFINREVHICIRDTVTSYKSTSHIF